VPSPDDHRRRGRAVPEGFWSSCDAATVLASGNIGRVFRAYRGAFDPAVRQATLGHWLDLSQAQISRIESGQTVVNDLRKLSTWATRLGIPKEVLWFTVSPDSPRASGRDGAVDTVARPRTEGDDVQRRAFLKTAGLGAMTAISPVATVPVSLRPPVIGPEDVEVLRETTCAFRQLDNRFGGGHGRGAVAAFLTSEVEPVLMEARFARGVRRDFLRASAELHQLAGWMAYDVADEQAGRNHLRDALRLASEAEDDALSAEMLAAMSHQAAFHRHADDAIDLSLAARRSATRAGAPALHAEAAALEAHGLALKGDIRGSIAALQRAEKAFLSATASNTPPWLRYFDEAYLSAKFAHALRDLARPDDAERFARSSLQMSDGYERGRLFNTALLATILVDRGHVDEAVEHAHIAVGMAGRVRSARARHYLHDVAVRLSPHSANTRASKVLAELTRVGVRAS
jgi:transcriptional regulator with XRE-family HTH domain